MLNRLALRLPAVLLGLLLACSPHSKPDPANQPPEGAFELNAMVLWPPGQSAWGLVRFIDASGQTRQLTFQKGETPADFILWVPDTTANTTRVIHDIYPAGSAIQFTLIGPPEELKRFKRALRLNKDGTIT